MSLPTGLEYSCYYGTWQKDRVKLEMFLSIALLTSMYQQQPAAVIAWDGNTLRFSDLSCKCECIDDILNVLEYKEYEVIVDDEKKTITISRERDDD